MSRTGKCGGGVCGGGGEWGGLVLREGAVMLFECSIAAGT